MCVHIHNVGLFGNTVEDVAPDFSLVGHRCVTQVLLRCISSVTFSKV